MNSIFNINKFNIHFNPDGFYNGKNSWLSDDSTIKIIWDTTLNAWKLSGNTLGSAQVINTNSNYPPINSNWTVLGYNYNVAANQGECLPITILNARVGVNDPGCICDGSIDVTATGGVPPYMYSYNGGVTYINTPLKTGLCGGEYVVKIKDSENTIVTKNVLVSDIIPTVNYSAAIKRISTTQITKTSVEYTFEIEITPPLPDGVNVLFNLNFNGVFMRTPYINSANSSFVPQLIKNGDTITGNNNTTETVGPNTAAGCQNFSTYNTNYSYTYPSLSFNNTDDYSIKVITNYQLTCTNTGPVYELNGDLGPLTFDLEDYDFSYRQCCRGLFLQTPAVSMSNLSLNGCDCCTITQSGYVKSLYE